MKKDRRKFLGTAATLLSASVAYPSSNFSIINFKKANTVKIGIIGTGSRGMGLMRILNRIEGVEIIGLCDTLSFRLKDASKIDDKRSLFY